MRDFKVTNDDIRPRGVIDPQHEGSKRAGFPYYYGGEFQVSYTPIRAGVFNIYVFGEIEDANQFIPAIEVLNAAGENDIVTIHLSTNGGSLDATDTFLDSMRTCEARIITRATGGVHSAGTVILINSDEFALSENFNCLIHNGSTGAGGKFSDFKAQAKASEKYMDTVLRRTYDGFLTEGEIEALIEGKDFWFDGEEFCTRYERRNEQLRERVEEAKIELMQSLGLTEGEAPKGPAKKRAKKKAPEAA